MIDGIQILRPDKTTPSDSQVSRYYKILHYRFVEQFTQQEVATDLGFSQRHLRRQEARAIQVLADYFWAQYQLEAQEVSESLEPASESVAGSRQSWNGRKEDLVLLGDKMDYEPLDLCEIIHKVLATIGPYLEKSNVHVNCRLPEMPQLVGKEMAVRQALIHLLLLGVQTVPGGTIEITTSVLSQARGMSVQIRTESHGDSGTASAGMNKEDRELAQELAKLAGGTLEFNITNGTDCPLAVSFVLHGPAIHPILVVDDNADTQRLFQLYLDGTQYEYVGLSDPHKALALATELSLAAIILDIMMPGVDGWELLGYLREHPKTSRIPIIVSSILPHGQFASILGATCFIKKPVQRKELLRILDQEVARAQRESDSGI